MLAPTSTLLLLLRWTRLLSAQIQPQALVHFVGVMRLAPLLDALCRDLSPPKPSYLIQLSNSRLTVALV